MSSTAERKAAARLDALGAIRALDRPARAAASQAVIARLDAIEAVRLADGLLGFAPLGTEPDLAPLLDRLRMEGRPVLVPRAGREAGVLEAVPLRSPISELPKDALGVRSPRDGDPVPLDRVSTVLVPGLMFDPWGKRLGRGGGYYDRLLGRLSGATLIGVCFEATLREEVPAEAHDRKVDMVVTESRTIDCVG